MIAIEYHVTLTEKVGVVCEIDRVKSYWCFVL